MTQALTLTTIASHPVCYSRTVAAQGRTMEGFPAPEETSPALLPGMGVMSSRAETGEHPMYVSVQNAHSASTVMAAAGVPPPNRPTQTVNGNGYIPRFAGHKPGTYNNIGGSVFGAEVTVPLALALTSPQSSEPRLRPRPRPLISLVPSPSPSQSEGKKQVEPSNFSWRTTAGTFNYGRATMNAPH